MNALKNMINYAYSIQYSHMFCNILERKRDKTVQITFCFRTKDSSLRFPLLVFLSVNLLLVLVAAIVLLGAPMLAKNGGLCLTEQCVNTGNYCISVTNIL